jgi:mono/diheme cytochrome c family protein
MVGEVPVCAAIGTRSPRARLLKLKTATGETTMMRIAFLTGLLTTAFGFLAVPAFAQSAQAELGQTVFVAQKCSICHSVAGKGNQKGALDNVGAKLSADEIRQWIVAAPDMAAKTKAERKPAMKAYPNVAKDDLDALVAYLQTLKK